MGRGHALVPPRGAAGGRGRGRARAGRELGRRMTSSFTHLYSRNRKRAQSRSASREAEGTGPLKPRQPTPTGARCHPRPERSGAPGGCRARQQGGAVPATSLRCRVCETEHPLEALAICSRCLGPLDPTYAHEPLSREEIAAGPPSLWRYAALLPVAPPDEPRLTPGFTPLVRAPRLAEELGVGELWLKLDTANPTHSFKDRVVAVAAAKAQELGLTTLACSSTGNLANAVAAR